MTKDNEQMIKRCNICQLFQARLCDLHLEKQPTPNHPWQTVASDHFEFNRGQYIVVADRYLKMCFVWKIPSAGAASTTVISKMKEIFAEHGVPGILRSDN